MQNLHLSESAHGLTAKHPGLTPSRPSELGSTSKIGRFGYSPLPIRCFEHFCIFIYLIFNYIYIYIYQYIYISLRNPFHLIKYTLIWEFFVKLREAISWSYGLRFSKTRTLFRVFFRDERNGVSRFP